MGSCCDLKISSGDTKEIAFLKDNPSSKCGDAQFAMHEAKVYWWEPALISQGSETGLFNTTLGCLVCGRRGCEEHAED